MVLQLRPDHGRISGQCESCRPETQAEREPSAACAASRVYCIQFHARRRKEVPYMIHSPAVNF